MSMTIAVDGYVVAGVIGGVFSDAGLLLALLLLLPALVRVLVLPRCHATFFVQSISHSVSDRLQ